MAAKEQKFSLVKADSASRFHVMRMQSTRTVGLSDFSMPLHLQRKRMGGSARFQHSHNNNNNSHLNSEPGSSSAAGANGGGASSSAAPAAVDKPALDRDLVAPYGATPLQRAQGSGGFRGYGHHKNKARQITIIDDRERKLKSEESQPWVLEDDQSEHVWVGQLERQQSEYMLFVLTDSGFKVVPVERWYRFKEKSKYQTLTIEQAEEVEKLRKKSRRQDRWLMDKFKASEADAMFGPDHGSDAAASSARGGGGSGGGGGGGSVRRSGHGSDDERQRAKGDGDFDELDFDLAEEFQDDEEDIFENFEDEREAAKRDMKQKSRVGFQYEGEEEDNNELSKDGVKLRKKLAEVDEEAYDTDDDNPYGEEEEAAEETKSQDYSRFPVPGGFRSARGDGQQSNASKKGSLPGSKPSDDAASGANGAPQQTMPGNLSMVSSFMKKRPADGESAGNAKKAKLKMSEQTSTAPATTASTATSSTMTGAAAPARAATAALATQKSPPISRVSATKPVAATEKPLAAASSGGARPAPATSTANGNGTEKSLVFTKEEIIGLIRARPGLTGKELVDLVKPRMKQHPQNGRETFVRIVREVAVKRPDGSFDLKDEYKRAQ
ncbi:transcription factor IIF subunit tfg1 [Sorochytrium milnesiophthora]